MRLVNKYAHYLMASGFAAAVAVISPPSDAGFDTSYLVETTIDQIPDCLDYRILGLSYRVIWTPYGPYYFWTLHVGHTIPAMVNQAHPYLAKMPWEDLSNLLGSSYESSSESAINSAFSGISGVKPGAGRYRHHKFGDNYAPQHYESALAGHPAMIIFQKSTKGGQSGGGSGSGSGSTNSQYFQGTGNVPSQGQGGGSSGGGSGNAGSSFMTTWQKGNSSSHGQYTTEQKEELNYDQTMSQIDSSDYTRYDETTSQVGSAVDDFEVSTGNSYYCTLPYTPFWPYYLSGLDGAMWRKGYPSVDAHLIVNPLKPGPIIGPSKSLLPEIWGHLYPRYGTVNHVDDAKASAVIASRGVSIFMDPQIGRIYWPAERPNGVAWSKVYPESTSCHKLVGNTGSKRDDAREYAWTNWFYARCDLDKRGMLVFRILFPEPIQVTDEIPD